MSGTTFPSESANLEVRRRGGRADPIVYAAADDGAIFSPVAVKRPSSAVSCDPRAEYKVPPSDRLKVLFAGCSRGTLSKFRGGTENFCDKREGCSDAEVPAIAVPEWTVDFSNPPELCDAILCSRLASFFVSCLLFSFSLIFSLMSSLALASSEIPGPLLAEKIENFEPFGQKGRQMRAKIGKDNKIKKKLEEDNPTVLYSTY